MIFWEYYITQVDGNNKILQLNNAGAEGWELVEIDNGYGIFKRQAKKQNKKQVLAKFSNEDYLKQ